MSEIETEVSETGQVVEKKKIEPSKISAKNVGGMEDDGEEVDDLSTPAS